MTIIEPKHTKIKRHFCTAEDPWSREKGNYALHPDAKLAPGAEAAKGAVKLKCPNCNLIFTLVAV